jgi:hypothetical protein
MPLPDPIVNEAANLPAFGGVFNTSGQWEIFTRIILTEDINPGKILLTLIGRDTMNETLQKTFTAFAGSRRLSSGPLIEVALAVRNAIESGTTDALLTFDDATGRVIDLDLRGTEADVTARLSVPVFPRAVRSGTEMPPEPGTGDEPSAMLRGRGRPKLGVVAREVTLLPRHWDWLGSRPGGASVTLRRLVEDARRTTGPQHRMRAAQEAAYRFMVAMAGDLGGFEEAIRALFAGDRERFDDRVAAWPADVREYATRLGFIQARAPAPSDQPVT